MPRISAPNPDPDRVLGQFASENPNPVLRVARNGVILYANNASQVLLTQINCRVGESVPRHLGQYIADIIRKVERSEIQVEAVGRTFSFAVTPIKEADYVYLYGHDITGLKEMERELVRQKEHARALALHDALTGFPNRTLLEDRLTQSIAQCVRLGKKLAVAFIDLDNFARINAAHGHQVGDRVLVEVARCVSGALRKTDTVARWGGDELILLLPGLNAAVNAAVVCERVKRVVQNEFVKDAFTASLTLSMGLAICPDDATSSELLFKKSDIALYQAKARGGNAIIMFGEARLSQ